VGGILTSTTDTSGLCSTAARTNAGPSPTFATTVAPDSSMSLVSPSRSRTESSAITTRSPSIDTEGFCPTQGTRGGRVRA
jgi:hypothetical protein